MWLWPQAIFVRGYQWDLEMQLRKLATGSAEADTRRALPNLPEPCGAAGGEAEPAHSSCGAAGLKFRYTWGVVAQSPCPGGTLQ